MSSRIEIVGRMSGRRRWTVEQKLAILREAFGPGGSVQSTMALRIALDEALRRLSPKAEMAKAITYGHKRWTQLTRFRDDGRLEIDNNIAERAMRSVAIGRKNWLFAGYKAGGERAAAIYTVIETCKLNGVEPQAYIADVIAKIAGDWPASRWDELMLWNWRPDFQSMAEAA